MNTKTKYNIIVLKQGVLILVAAVAIAKGIVWLIFLCVFLSIMNFPALWKIKMAYYKELLHNLKQKKNKRGM